MFISHIFLTECPFEIDFFHVYPIGRIEQKYDTSKKHDGRRQRQDKSNENCSQTHCNGISYDIVDPRGVQAAGFTKFMEGDMGPQGSYRHKGQDIATNEEKHTYGCQKIRRRFHEKKKVICRQGQYDGNQWCQCRDYDSDRRYDHHNHFRNRLNR